MHIQLGLLCSASKLNFATWAWIGHFFHEQGAEGRRLGRIAEGRAQGSWAGSPCTIPGGTAGQTGDDGVCQGHSSCSSHQLTTPCPPAERSEGGWVASAFPTALAPQGGSQAVTLLPSPLPPRQPRTLPRCLFTSASKQSWNRAEQRGPTSRQPDASAYFLKKNTITKNPMM